MKIVDHINSRLRGKAERSNPSPLLANKGLRYQGSIVLGMGFVLNPEEQKNLIAKNKRNAERIFPYLGGEDVNTSPTQEHNRYVINFDQMSLEEAGKWPELLGIVREKVKPERDRASHSKGPWWLFESLREQLYTSIHPLQRCLVNLFTTKHLTFSFVPTKQVFANSLWVYPCNYYTFFTILQSRIHEPWARLLSSSLEDRLRYAASDCFDTFPFPKEDPRAVIPKLEKTGKALYEARAQLMKERQQGLTVTYNQLKDPTCIDQEIKKLRTLHEQMDQAVLESYGWDDIKVPPYTIKDEYFEDKIIDRLFLLNEERYNVERCDE